MKPILVIYLIFFGVYSVAHTRGNLTGPQMLLNITSRNYDGSVDGSPQKLFEDLNVAEQSTFLGLGKVLSGIPDKVLNFVCGKRGDNNYQCSIILHRSPYSRLQSGKAFIEFRGELASVLYEQFHSNGIEYSFKDEAGIIWIFSTPERFFIKFDAQGV